MKYYIIAGEASGDLHGSNLMKGLKAEDEKADFRIWGGDLMEAEGGQLVKHYRDLAFMGFWEVLKNIRTILGNIKMCKRDILTYQPDVLILIDYPGFNLRIAKWAKAQGIRVFYYISPQIWAWHSSRVHGIKASVDRMFVILPFERDFYAKYDYEVDFVGHPLMDVVEAFEAPADFTTVHQLNDAPIIALLPGSRKQEIERLLNVMLSIVPDFPGYQFVIAGAPSQERAFYERVIQLSPLSKEATERVHFTDNQTYALLQHAEAALVTSGTATLETALFEVPQVVCYKGSPLSYYIARQVVNVDYISLVNLIANREIVRELIQDDCNPERIREELSAILAGGDRRESMKADYDALKNQIGQGGASRKAARLMVQYAQSEG
ncbi:MAG: lipid-A-disaccharide synthase [Phaeodactylibacter xiamenensis]|uniref:Lipid-A-disaccharide synthase n=1 Tax=Phaeodactylibacter xiamenensis TaxID=1524460 RepID=A0A098S3H2_9BACT|nr:lipid-A-disaccharide synthase [Phaeodactylibacter xiamenensis]KGE85742.1 lipid-A-disaccharide synthase [Phaeodactylibacter xiamenensis]MCR9050510.1 lipid-A-disaccharide synthase [bacterium]